MGEEVFNVCTQQGVHTVHQRVLNSIGLLDAKGPPDWRDKLRPHMAVATMGVQYLDMCPLCHIYGNYVTGIRALELNWPGADDCYAFRGHGIVDTLNQDWMRAMEMGL